jgi:hypothetical protein
MSKTLVDKKICDACGADVRPGSGFCYNCGGAVAQESNDLPKTEANIDLKEVGDVWRQSDLAENSDFKTSNIDLKTTKLKKEEVIETIDLQPIGKPGDVDLSKTIESPASTKSSLQDEAKLKSAANMRRKAKSFQKKTVEVVWEEPENAPNKWFPIVAIFLILLVVGIFYLAMYLK